MSRGGHLLTATSAAALIAACQPNTHGFTAALCAVVASSLPDVSEGVIGYTIGGTRLSLVPHRTATHLPFLWIALLLLGQYLPTITAFGTRIMLGDVAAGLAVGALVHCLIDAFSPSGIPLLQPFGERTSFGPYTNRNGRRYLYKTGSIEELFIIGPAVLAAGIAIAVRWHDVALGLHVLG